MTQWTIKRLSEMSAPELYAVMQARADVFVREQKILYPDADGMDPHCLHLYTRDAAGRVLAYLRMYAGDAPGSVQFGRVLTTARGQGLGKALMHQALPAARDQLGARTVMVHAQLPAAGFYQKLGFQRISDVFMEAGVPHVAMRYALADPAAGRREAPLS